MNLDERQRRFVEAAKARFAASGGIDHVHQLFGVSNAPRIVEGGIQLCVVNLERAKPATDARLFAGVMRFPPEDEVYFAFLVRRDGPALFDRLERMVALGTGAVPKGPGDDIAYGDRNNHVRVYLADGGLWLRNAGFWESLPEDLSPFGPKVELDGIVVALHPPAASVRRSVLAREFIGWLGGLVGEDRIHELAVWTDAAQVGPAMRRMPSEIPVSDLESAIADAGGHYPGGEIRHLHASLNFLPHKHFVVLSGLSGTGKTRLAMQYARAVHGLGPDEDDPLLFVCPVRPEWTDPSGLTGYVDVLRDQYVVPPFLEAILVATAHRDSPVFAILDELNLARVEHYLSDVLSAMETGSPLQLHSESVPMKGSTGTRIRAELHLPTNLFVIGTINVDETTSPLSDKVLDRALLIDMSTVDLSGFLAKLGAEEPALRAACEALGPGLERLHGLLDENRFGFGYRVAEECVRYHAFAAEHLGSEAEEALDRVLVQKVLVKLRGTERQRDLLVRLGEACEDLPVARALLGRMTDDLDEYGSFEAVR